MTPNYTHTCSLSKLVIVKAINAEHGLIQQCHLVVSGQTPRFSWKIGTVNK